MGKRSRDKGARREREVVELMHELGIQAQRVPLSGAAGGQFSDDVQCRLAGWRFSVEVKARAAAEGWQTLKKWMGGADALVLIEDRQQPLILLPWDHYSRLVRMTQQQNFSTEPPLG